ncbi:RNA polymerase II transcription factor SIII subunit A [Madurella fahalii]|uniref:RNA polymerase II transcription factor SIII subunit A n=1 Tax=Madurella fahalii TaxID=1157608 RepID=A0ABQ0FXZ3_9PEZI
MPGPRSLAEMCMAVAIDNIKNITSFGSLPAELVSPLLRLVKTADHLHALEVDSDDLYGATAEHWQRIIKKDFPILSSKHNFVPESPKSWFKVWQMYRKLEEEANAAATEKLKQGLAAHKEQRDSHRAVIISAKESRNLRLPKPPGPRTSRHWSLQPRQKQTFLSKTRAELAARAKHFKLATPTGKLQVPAGQIKNAPEAMLNNARIALQANPEIRTIRAPRKTVPQSMSAREREMKERGARLLQIKRTATGTPALNDREDQLPKNKSSATANIVRFSDDEDQGGHGGDGLDEYDDLFGDLASDSPSRHGALSVELLEESVPSQSQSTPKQASKRRRGLSAAPGANKITETAKSPPKTSTRDAPPTFPAGQTSPGAAPPKPTPHTADLSTGPQLPAGSSSLPMQLKRKRPLLDVCMRTDKSKRFHR